MLARRTLAITPDKELARALKTALMAAGTVGESADSIDALPDEVHADVCVVHLPDNQVAKLAALGARLGPKAWIIVVLGKYDLPTTVAAMQATDRVSAILVAERFQPSDLAATVTRLVHGDIFGLDKVVPWGTKVYSMMVADYREKAIAINQLSEFAATAGVRRKYREALEQCADEMLMNALYDAPVGPDGKQLFAEIPTKERIAIKLDQRVVVQYACDDKAFALSVRDAYGSFDRATLLRFLHKCLHSDQQIDRKAGGAGLGLYLMANSASLIFFNLLPGVATEVICIFDITAPKLQLHQIGVYSEKVDGAGQLVGGPTRVAGVPGERAARGQGPVGSTPRALMLALGSAIVLLLAIIALVAYPRFDRSTGAVEIATVPPGAAVEIDGRLRGTTAAGPLLVRDLRTDTGHRVIARLDGHGDAETLVEVDDDRTSTVQLTLPVRTATVVIESEPTGATILLDGRELGETPLTLTLLPPDREVELLLRLAGHRDSVRRLRVPPPGGQALLSASLTIAEELASIRITSEPPGAAVLQNGERLAGLMTPVATYLVEADRKYSFTLELPGYMPAMIEAQVGQGQRDVPVHAALVPGGQLIVTANVPARATVSATRVCKRRGLPLDCPIENGVHVVDVRNIDPYLNVSFPVTIAGDKVRRDLRLGLVEARPGFKLAAGGTTSRAVALAEGEASVVLVPDDGAELRTLKVAVRPGATISVP